MQGESMSVPSTIRGINRLPENEKREIYARVIPEEIIDHFHLSPYFVDKEGNDLLWFDYPEGSSDVEMALRHIPDFPDPVVYGHLTDTLNGQIHVLLYVINNPDGERYDVDVMPDGTSTRFGTRQRNHEAELAALKAGLAPGQIRQGMRMLSSAFEHFEKFIISLGHDIYFIEPLFYHNALVFEMNGFNYQQGRRRMERIQAGFSDTNGLLSKLDGKSPFRQPQAANSIRLRSWAIHDGILGEPFTDITMYKRVGKHAGLQTAKDCHW
jgi:hypothetical protein